MVKCARSRVSAPFLQRVTVGKDTLNEEDFDRVKLKLEMDGIEVELMGEDVEKDLNSRAWEFKKN